MLTSADKLTLLQRCRAGRFTVRIASSTCDKGNRKPSKADRYGNKSRMGGFNILIRGAIKGFFACAAIQCKRQKAYQKCYFRHKMILHGMYLPRSILNFV